MEATPRIWAQGGFPCTTDPFSQSLLPLCSTVGVGGTETLLGPSPLTSWTMSGGQHFVYIDVNNNIDQMWYTTASGEWATQNLTTMLGAVPAVLSYGLTNWTQSDGPHFVYEDANGHVHQIWYITASGEWNTQDLTDLADAPVAEQFTTFTSWVDTSGNPHFVYIDSNLDIDQISYTASSGEWATQNLTNTVDVPLATVSFGLTSWTQSDGPHFVFEDRNGHVHQIWYTTASGKWNTQDLTEMLSAPIAAQLTTFTSWMMSDGPHFVYIDSNGDVDQMWYATASGEWGTQNLTEMLGATTAVISNGLTSWTQSDGPHFIYEDANGHVHQMWYTTASGEWATEDLTEILGAPTALGTAFTSWVDSSGDPHIMYIDSKGDIDQMWYTLASGEWATQNLTEMLSAPLANN
jgi:hypothetical protein